MIASITRGASFRGLLAYVLDPKHSPALVASNMGGQDPADLACEFGRALRERRTRGARDVHRPVVHTSLSFAPEDRRLSHAELSLIAEQFVSRMGYDGCQYAAVEHNDRNHQHLHIVVSRVRPDGSLVREELGDYQLAMRVCRELEREHGLQQVTSERGVHQATKDEYRSTLRTQDPSERKRAQALVLAAVAGGPTLGEFVARLEGQGVQVRLLRADDGPILGISFRLDRFSFRGTALGPRFCWRGLQREGLRYNALRDKDVVERVSRRAAAGPGRARTYADQLAATRRAIDEILERRPTLRQFASTLERRGVSLRLNVARTGHVSGISYGVAGTLIKGSDLGRPYSWHAIGRRGLRYDAERDVDLAHRLAGQGGGGGGSFGRPVTDPATEQAKRRLEHDEARRLTPEYQQELLAKAPREAFIRERGEVRASRNLDNYISVDRIRSQTLSSTREEFADEPKTPGVSIYPQAGYVERDSLPPSDQLKQVDGYALVWRDGEGQIVGAALVDGCTRRPTVPEELRQGFHDQLTAVQSVERANFTRWWVANRHRLEGGDVGAIAVDEAFPREVTRQAVRELQTEMARHRVDRRLPFEKEAFPSSLSTEGARSLKNQMADLQLTSAITQAAVRNLDALQRLVVMPDTGRPLTRAELLRGVMDIADGGGRQFHIEALAVKRAVRPLAHDPESFKRAFGFDLAVLPPVPIIVLAELSAGRHELHFEDVFGQRLEEHNARVVESQGRARDEGVHGEAGPRGERAPGEGARGEDAGRGRDIHDVGARIGVPPPEALAGAPLPQPVSGRGPSLEQADRAQGVPTPESRPLEPTHVDLAFVREAIRQALADRPTLSGFVSSVEAKGIAVRLYRGDSGDVYAIGFRLGRLNVSGHTLGPGFNWAELQRCGLSVDRSRDRETLDRVAETLTPSKPAFHRVLHAADRLAYAAGTLRRNLHLVQDLVEDPAGALGRTAARAAWGLVVRGLSDLAREAGRTASDNLTQQNDRAVLQAAGRADQPHLASRDESHSAVSGRHHLSQEDRDVTSTGPRRDTEPDRRQPPGTDRSADGADRDGSGSGHRELDRGDRGTHPAGAEEHRHADPADPQADQRAGRQDARPGDAAHRGDRELDAHDEPARGAHPPRDGGVQPTPERDRDPVGQDRDPAPQSGGGGGLDPERSEAAGRRAGEGDGRGHGREAGALDGGSQVPGQSRVATAVVHPDTGDPARAHRAPDGELASPATARDAAQEAIGPGPADASRDRTSGRAAEAGIHTTAASRSAEPSTVVTSERDGRETAMETAPSNVTPAPPSVPGPARIDSQGALAAHDRERGGLQPRLADMSHAEPARTTKDPVRDVPADLAGVIERAQRLAEEFKQQAGAGMDPGPPVASPQERPTRTIYGAELQPEVADAVERARAIAEEITRAAGPTTATEPEAQSGQVVGTGAEIATSVLRHVPDPSRIKDLSESPEKAALAGARTAASIALPQAAPVIGTAANAAEKEVERSQVPDHLP